ncbi:MAG TPA: NifU family protein [Chthoniobacterales bacterium]|nr:NifU family protein [Chthoniobacterales bacterium]
MKKERPVRSLDADINSQGEHIQKLLERIEALPYPGTKELMQECMEAVLAFYGQGLSRILQVVGDAGPDGHRVYQDLIHDDVIQGLLLIHDLHPLDLETRLRGALDKVRPYLRRHGGNVELISLENDVARLRLQGTCKSCASSSVTLELAIRHAIEQACPDLVHFEVEGGVPDEGSGAGSRLSGQKSIAWIVIEDAGRLAEGAWLPVRVEQMRLVICKVNGTFYVYRNRCPACNMPFDGGDLAGGFLSCGLGHRYDVVHAGRCAEIPSAHLDPFPLLLQDGVVKVALTRDVANASAETVAQSS